MKNFQVIEYTSSEFDGNVTNRWTEKAKNDEIIWNRISKNLRKIYGKNAPYTLGGDPEALAVDVFYYPDSGEELSYDQYYKKYGVEPTEETASETISYTIEEIE